MTKRSYLTQKGEGKIFAREPGTIAPQFVPDKNHTLAPLGNADAQVEEAMVIAKKLNSEPEDDLQDRIAKISAMHPATAMNFLDGLSPYERERYLMAERYGKGRKTVLGRYGWSK